MTLAILLLLLGGLVLLVAGGEFLVRGASRLAALVGISPLVVGLTIVAYGTSAPEFAVSVHAGLSGSDSIAVANVVGSNIFNVLFILGACALLAPLVVKRRLVRVDVPVMIAASALAAVLALDGRFGRLECLVFAAGAIGYTWWSVRSSRAETAAATVANPAEQETIAGKHPGWLIAQLSIAALGSLGWARGWWGAAEAGCALAGGLAFLAGSLFGKGGTTRAGDLLHQIGFIFAGLAIIVLGAAWLVDGAVVLAKNLGVSDAVIGLTIVAAGTSLPEVATSIVATLRGQRDLAIGNVVGSNIANLLFILGFSGSLLPNGLAVAPDLLALDIPVMLAVAVVCLPVFYTGYLIRRWEGAVFLAAFVGYITYLVFNATGHSATAALGAALGWIFVPVVLATFTVTGVRALTTRHRAA